MVPSNIGFMFLENRALEDLTVGLIEKAETPIITIFDNIIINRI
jgi:hypothetical protein